MIKIMTMVMQVVLADHHCFPPPTPLPFVLLVHNPSSPAICDEQDDEIEKDLTVAQRFLLDDTTKQSLAIRGKVVVAEKIRSSKSLKKLFLNVDEVFENNDQKLIYDAAKPLSRTKTTITQTQVMFKELKQGKLPNN